MLGKENGRMLLNNVKLIEYDQGGDTQSFFLQLGVVGFYATEDEPTKWPHSTGKQYQLKIEL